MIASANGYERFEFAITHWTQHVYDVAGDRVRTPVPVRHWRLERMKEPTSFSGAMSVPPRATWSH